MGELIKREILEALRLQRQFNTPGASFHGAAAFPPDRDAAVLLEMAREEDTLALSGMPPDHPGFKILRGNVRHALLQTVFGDSIERYWACKVRNDLQNLNERWFWTFPDRPLEPLFVTPAHLCRSFDMAVNLGNHGRVDFSRPDADGRLPMHYIARYAKDEDLIPLLVMKFNVSADRGTAYGRQRGHDDAPVFLAVEAGNLPAVRGFAKLPPDRVDLNARGIVSAMTPLIYAVLKAEDTVSRLSSTSPPPSETFRRLAIVRHLASSPFVNPDLEDSTRFKARDYAASPFVHSVLERGLAKRLEIV